ncbi:hypothetical protein [Mycobacterium sp. TY814]|uniref:hypothetical protein n=1 Tax=Mycobacterium sp. TY814 TaxID=3050580 RepID=UPI0027408EB5|nr:hypothetical protein [Mycobacterium sp. TY814]MDP7720753.1 hypothetical protein [Mycobacterium sp. TY814]
MSETPRGYSPRRTNEVVDVAVHADEPRPVWITVHDHAHTYEIAWHDTANGPVITDLRVTSANGAPIKTDSLKRIRTDKLLRAARRYDTATAAEAGRKLRATFDAALGSTDVDTSGIEALRFTDGLADALIRNAPPGAEVPIPKRRRGGRPPTITREFLALVADWAREGRDRDAAVYPFVGARAAAHLGIDHAVPDDTVKGWIRRCKQVEPPLLGRDELRRPRTPSTTAKGEDC